MKQRLIILVSETHAHVLPEGACNLPLKTAVKDVRASIRQLPYLSCFKDVAWEIEECFIEPEKIGVLYNNPCLYQLCKCWKIDNLQNLGYKVV